MPVQCEGLGFRLGLGSGIGFRFWPVQCVAPEEGCSGSGHGAPAATCRVILFFTTVVYSNKKSRKQGQETCGIPKEFPSHAPQCHHGKSRTRCWY